MGLNSFDHMVMMMDKFEFEVKKTNPKISIEVPIAPSKKITQAELDCFLKHFTFDKLKDETLAKSFSRYFEIDDILFKITISDELAMDHIKKYYLL